MKMNKTQDKALHQIETFIWRKQTKAEKLSRDEAHDLTDLLDAIRENDVEKMRDNNIFAILYMKI